MRPGFEDPGTQGLVHGALQIAKTNNLSSVHVTFCTAEEAARGREMGLLHRITQQYHWENRNYADFDAFPVFRTKVVSPFGYAMGLIDRQAVEPDG